MSKQLEDKLEKLSPEQLKLHSLRHTCEHVLHTAMQNLYPTLKKAMGPAIEEGFYFDFDLDDKISEEDFPMIENEMKRLISLKAKMVQEFVTLVEAKKLFAHNPYKLEWIDLISKRGEKISIYKMIDSSQNIIDLDICAGPHTISTAEIKAFKLLSVAGAYWHGDEKNKMLSRIYGTCFASQKELDEYISLLNEAKKRDHRKLGKDLDLFVFSDLVGKGLPMLTSKGTTIRRILERFIVDEELNRDYQHVITPPIAKVDLYRTSGHYPYYKDTMYPPMVVDDEELILRPMTCPHHFMLFKSRPRSYHEMPVRFAEISPQFRYEKSGELTGLMRIRMFMLADAHIICEKKSASEEIKNVLDLINFVNTSLGLIKGIDYRYRLSLGNRNDTKKYFKDDSMWDEAENVLRNVLNETQAPFFEVTNEAAFYGPKIDIQLKNVHGKEETAFTVQYDFVMPKRFELKFINSQGLEEKPIVIHRASLGCFERTMAFLIEKYAGAFPLWLSPIQVHILPVSEKHFEFSKKIYSLLKNNRIRVEINLDNKTLGAKIRESTLQKIPFMVIIGDKEAMSEKGKEIISIRSREGVSENLVELSYFINRLRTQIEKFQ